MRREGMRSVALIFLVAQIGFGAVWLFDAPVVLAYTALDRHDLYHHEEYKDGMKHFNRVVNKREDLPDLLSLVDVWVGQ